MASNQEIKVYGDIGYKNNSSTLIDTLTNLEKTGCKELTIRLHCYGGSVFEGNVMFNMLKNSPFKVKIIIDGIAASMASILLLVTDDVEIAENGYIMIHSPSSVTQGTAKEHEQTTKLLYDIEDNFSKLYAERTGLSVNEVKAKWFDGNEHWLNADEAVNLKFAKRKIQSVSKNIKSLDKEVVSSMGIKNVYDRYVALLTNKNETKMKKELIEMFGLKGLSEESSDTAVLQGIQNVFDDLNGKVNENNEMAIKSLVDNAIRENKIYSSMRETYETIGKTSGVDALSAVLSSITNKRPITDLIVGGKGSSNEATASANPAIKNKKDWNLDDYRMYAPNELRDNPTLYDQLIEKEYGKE